MPAKSQLQSLGFIHTNSDSRRHTPIHHKHRIRISRQDTIHSHTHLTCTDLFAWRTPVAINRGPFSIQSSTESDVFFYLSHRNCYQSRRSALVANAFLVIEKPQHLARPPYRASQRNTTPCIIVCWPIVRGKHRFLISLFYFYLVLMFYTYIYKYLCFRNDHIITFEYSI